MQNALTQEQQKTGLVSQVAGATATPTSSAASQPESGNLSMQTVTGGSKSPVAYTGTVDPTKTTQGLVSQITSKDSDLMQLAEQRGFNLASRRGLGNSSVAAQAAQASVLDAAMPIATNDAAIYQNQQLKNQDSMNMAATAANQERMTRVASNLDLRNQQRLMGADYQNKLTLMQKEFENSVKMQGITAATEEHLTRVRTELQNFAVDNEFRNRILQQYMEGVNSVLSNKDMSPQQMQGSINKLYENLQGTMYLQQVTSAIDFSAYKPDGSNITDAFKDTDKKTTKTLTQEQVDGLSNSITSMFNDFQKNYGFFGATPDQAMLTKEQADSFISGLSEKKRLWLKQNLNTPLGSSRWQTTYGKFLQNSTLLK